MALSLIGQQFKIIKEDPDVTEQFPLLVKGLKFQVLSDDKENGHADSITGIICLTNGKIITIKDNPNSIFYCFWKEHEIGKLIKPIKYAPKPVKHYGGKIVIKKFGAKLVDISEALDYFSKNEDDFSEKYTVMKKASNYIKHLEGLLNDRN